MPRKIRKLKWHEVCSSNLAAVGYRNKTLYIRFHPGKDQDVGREYCYPGVPLKVFRALLAADKSVGGSVGQTFNVQVRMVYTDFHEFKVKQPA